MSFVPLVQAGPKICHAKQERGPQHGHVLQQQRQVLLSAPRKPDRAPAEHALPDDAAVARRDAMLAEVAGAEGGGERVRCKVYEVDGGTARSGVVDE